MKSSLIRFVLTVPAVKRQVRPMVGESGASAAVGLHDSAAVRDHFEALSGWAREAFVAFYLNTKNDLLHAELISIGTIDSAAVYPREVVRAALEVGASNVILAHNHPSGDPDPSGCDKAITRDLVFALGLMQIKVLDHVIIGANGRWCSFATMGLMDEYGREFSGYSHLGEPHPWVTP
jgi:DNA repair protein RadC